MATHRDFDAPTERVRPAPAPEPAPRAHRRRRDQTPAPTPAATLTPSLTCIRNGTDTRASRLPTDSFRRADATTRSGRAASLRALHVVEYALAAPAPRRERTWLHRVKIAVDVLADSIDRQIRADEDSIGLLSEIALSEPAHTQAVLDLRAEQRDLRIAVASIREQLDEHPELPIDTAHIRDRLADLAHQYHQHQTREAELIDAALDIDITETPEPRRT